jgi:hypothetical protein
VFFTHIHFIHICLCFQQNSHHYISNVPVAQHGLTHNDPALETLDFIDQFWKLSLINIIDKACNRYNAWIEYFGILLSQLPNIAVNPLHFKNPGTDAGLQPRLASLPTNGGRYKKFYNPIVGSREI